MDGIWTLTREEGYEAWQGRSEGLSLTVVPSLGAKAISFKSLRTGREWLWRSGKPLGNPGYGSPFSAGDESGWDEMCPGIDACLYPEEPWRDRPVPDHGEVWSLPWSAVPSGGALRCRVEGLNFPYALEKTYTFSGPDTLRIDYSLTNRGNAPFSFLWAAHPLFRASEDMRIRVPGDLNEIEVSYSHNRRLGAFGDRRSWPLVRTEGGEIDLGRVEPDTGLAAEKYYFTGRLKEGWAELADTGTGEAVLFRFPADKVPYLAVWANYGGYGGHYHIALEPATGRMDSLAVATERGEAATAGPGDRYEWYLELEVR